MTKFEGHEVKGQDHMRSQIDLKALQKYHSRLESSGFSGFFVINIDPMVQSCLFSFSLLTQYI